MNDTKLPRTKACGFLIVRGDPIASFLLMRHPKRWDLPKGHIDPGETEMVCALRELQEETGIEQADIEVDPHFRFSLEYVVQYGDRFNGQKALKTAVYFLARLKTDVELKLTEHGEFRWFDWQPPHAIQAETINPLLDAVAQHLDSPLS